MLACGFALLAGTASAAPAANASGIPSAWVQQPLPAGYLIGGALPANSAAPVSCVPGTTFCAVIVSDSGPSITGEFYNQAVLVTTNGTSWSNYGDLPVGGIYDAISCPTTSVCYAVGDGSPDSVISTNGGQTWNPTGAQLSGNVTAIDCMSAAICLVSYSLGGASGTSYTLNSGQQWLGASQVTGYYLNGISCWDAGGGGNGLPAASDCVAVGGTNNANGGSGIVLTGSDVIGQPWQQSTSPVLGEISDLFGVSCVPNGSKPPTCYAVGTSDNSSGSQQGPVELVSDDGGATWSATEFVIDNGWLNSISCANISDCWAGGGGTALALAGTDDGGATWYPDAVSNTNELNSVSCASVNFCVATADDALWVTTDDGGISGEPAPSPSIAKPTPLITPASVSGTAGHAQTVTGQDRKVDRGTSVEATAVLPDGHKMRSNHRTDRFFFYTWRVSSTPIGTTRVQFSVAGKTLDSVTIRARESGKAAAPKIFSANHGAFRVGRRFSFPVRVSGSPHPLLWETGRLPKGVHFNSVTGRLAGTPARGSSQTYNITFSATNGAKPDAVQHFRLVIRS